MRLPTPLDRWLARTMRPYASGIAALAGMPLGFGIYLLPRDHRAGAQLIGAGIVLTLIWVRIAIARDRVLRVRGAR